jgi:hypothetical protein
MPTRNPSKQTFGKDCVNLVVSRDKTLLSSFARLKERPINFPCLAGELVRLKVDVIVALYVPCALAAKQATTDIPIVAIAADPDPCWRV